MIAQFLDWLKSEEGVMHTYSSKAIDDFLSSREYAPSTRNRMANEIVRFAKTRLEKESLTFVKAIEKLDEREPMPEAER